MPNQLAAGRTAGGRLRLVGRPLSCLLIGVLRTGRGRRIQTGYGRRRSADDGTRLGGPVRRRPSRFRPIRRLPIGGRPIGFRPIRRRPIRRRPGVNGTCGLRPGLKRTAWLNWPGRGPRRAARPEFEELALGPWPVTKRPARGGRLGPPDKFGVGGLHPAARLSPVRLRPLRPLRGGRLSHARPGPVRASCGRSPVSRSPVGQGSVGP
jgi:hypothetical protein